MNVIAAIEPMSTPARDERDDAPDETRRLAGAGAGLDEQVGVEVVGDAVACPLVERPVEGQFDVGHDSPPPDESSSIGNHWVRRGSWRLRTHSP